MATVPVFLPGELHGQRSLVGYRSWGHKELVTTERLSTHTEYDRETNLFHEIYDKIFTFLNIKIKYAHVQRRIEFIYIFHHTRDNILI